MGKIPEGREEVHPRPGQVGPSGPSRLPPSPDSAWRARRDGVDLGGHLFAQIRHHETSDGIFARKEGLGHGFVDDENPTCSARPTSPVRFRFSEKPFGRYRSYNSTSV